MVFTALFWTRCLVLVGQPHFRAALHRPSGGRNCQAISKIVFLSGSCRSARAMSHVVDIRYYLWLARYVSIFTGELQHESLALFWSMKTMFVLCDSNCVEGGMYLKRRSTFCFCCGTKLKCEGIGFETERCELEVLLPRRIFARGYPLSECVTSPVCRPMLRHQRRPGVKIFETGVSSNWHVIATRKFQFVSGQIQIT